MALNYDVVTQTEARSSYLIIGIQVGMFGYIVRLGLYKQQDCSNEKKKKIKK